MAACGRELDGVGKQIYQNLRDPLGICSSQYTLISGNPIERESLLREKRLDQLDSVLDGLAGSEVDEIIGYASAADASELLTECSAIQG